jgi:hypothetical protein
LKPNFSSDFCQDPFESKNSILISYQLTSINCGFLILWQICHCSLLDLLICFISFSLNFLEFLWINRILLLDWLLYLIILSEKLLQRILLQRFFQIWFLTNIPNTIVLYKLRDFLIIFQNSRFGIIVLRFQGNTVLLWINIFGQRLTCSELTFRLRLNFVDWETFFDLTIRSVFLWLNRNWFIFCFYMAFRIFICVNISQRFLTEKYFLLSVLKNIF